MARDPFLVLRSGDAREERLEYIGLQVEALVMIFGKSFLRKGAREAGHGVVEHFWVEKAPKDAATVVIVEDADMPARYLYVSSADARHAHLVWKNLKFLLPVVSVESLLREAATPARFPGGLSRLALATGTKPRDEVAERIARGLKSKNREVRLDAAQATVISRLHAFAPHLEAAAEREKDAMVRRALRHALSTVLAGATASRSIGRPRRRSTR